MAATEQNFVTFAGDTVRPIFTVRNSSNQVVDISTVLEIAFYVQPAEDPSATPIITKTKTGGGITFVTNGTDGKFTVTMSPSDTTGLAGYYEYKATVTDGSSAVTTTSTGRMQIGPRPSWTYNPALIATKPLYQVRRLIGDVLEGDQQMQDEEISWHITNYSSIWSAAAACCRSLAAQFARLVDTVQGDLRTLYGQRARNYLAMAISLEQQAKGRGSASYVYAGGISRIDKENQVTNTDRVEPQFNLMLFDNLLPVSPAGNQVPGSRAPDSVPGV